MRNTNCHVSGAHAPEIGVPRVQLPCVLHSKYDYYKVWGQLQSLGVVVVIFQNRVIRDVDVTPSPDLPPDVPCFPRFGIISSSPSRLPEHSDPHV